MKIIKNETKSIPSIFPFRTKCEYCNAELEVDKEDAYTGEYGLYDYICPCCNMKNTIDDGIDLTKDNLQFPIHYHSFNDGKDISNEEVDKWVKECIEKIEKDKESYISWTGTGNTKVFVQKFDGDNEYSVTVSKWRHSQW